MFEGLTTRLEGIFKKLRARGKLKEEDVNEALKEVRLALLEADVNYKVVKRFVEKVRERAVGQEVLQSLTPGQQVVKIVKEELTTLMGGTHSDLSLGPHSPHIITLVGIQGSGKTTSCAKLAYQFKKEGHSPLLVATDLRRPAAIEQLEVLGRQIDVEVFKEEDKKDPVEVCRKAIERAKRGNHRVVIIDTAGRLHVDEELMEELVTLKGQIRPHEILLVADAMTGQDAVNLASTFHERLGIDGIILTKMEGDARGGAALSIREVTGKPIKYVGVGEKLDRLEPFHPERMASQILGMGDILSLIEKAERAFSAEKAQEMERKVREESFTLEDFRDQLQQIKQMGPLEQLLGMIPGLKGIKGLQVDDKELVRIEAIINSMTPRERQDYTVIDGSRRRRIAAGSGTTVQDVNRLLKQFAQTRKLMKMMVSEGKKGKGFPRKRLFL
ncbi:MAG: signal recognition particle protein [Candidatus Tectomicrobia bacterium]|uniref:Signal recognition particle protein n=1 Tax=Tectimicrobiota bacterium TaxID=2528274 RepID=A0A932FWU2_UNCTE|nr:signal recognition particle protein [Candidatus Tectomicrobia bacterium]